MSETSPTEIETSQIGGPREQVEPRGESPPDRQWSALHAFWATWLMPATAARRLGHVGLGQAFGIHVLSGFAALFGVTGIISIVERGTPFEIWGELVNQVTRRPTQFLIGLSITFGVVEVLSVLLADLLLAWGAREERLRSSIYQAMRVVWLQSMSVAVAMVAMGGLISLWETRVWRLSYSGNWQERPWYSRHGAEILSYAAVALFTWAFWTMLRAAGARKVQPPADAPPTCQSCGYNLVATATDGACPECGESVLSSLAPDARPGIEWERKRCRFSPDAWFTTTLQAFRRPRAFGRALQVYSPPAGHRRFLLVSLVFGSLAGLLGATCWLAGYVSKGGLFVSRAREATAFYGFTLDDFFWVIAPASAIIAGLGLLVLSLLVAGTMGLLHSLGAGRNLLAAAMRCSAYLSGFLVLVLVANLPLAFLFAVAPDMGFLNHVGWVLGLNGEDTALLVWCLLNLVPVGIYLRKLHAMLCGARNATR